MASVKDLLNESESKECQELLTFEETASESSEETAPIDIEKSSGRLRKCLQGISVFGLISALFYLVMSIVALVVFKTQEYAIDITQDALPMFLLFLGCSLAPMGLIVSPIGILANIIAKRYKTKFVSVLNAFMFAFASLLLACIVML